MKRPKAMQAFNDRLAKELYGMTLSEAIRTGICLKCKQPALPKCYSQAEMKEYTFSGLCKECFDKFFKE